MREPEMEPETERMAVIAVDLGGTTTRVAIVLLAPGQGVPYIPGAATFATEQDYTAQMTRLGAVVAGQLFAGAQFTQRRIGNLVGVGNIAGVGVSLGGRIARDGRSVAVAPNLRDYEGRPFVEDLSAHCGGLPTRLAHDAVCGLLAERLPGGALADAERCAYLTLSTGTGCAIHLATPDGSAGVSLSIELGHQLLDHNPRVCLCGQIGCLETYTGGRQLAQRHGQPIETLSDAETTELWRDFIEKLSLGLVNLAHLTRVERVAIGGAIALHHPELAPALQARLTERLRGTRLDLVPARWRANAPLLGAAALLATPESDLLH